MKRLTKTELKDLVGRNRLLYGTAEKPGLMLTPDNRIVKSFYQRKIVSTSTFIPQVRRFTANSRRLSELGIPAPMVEDVMYCRDLRVHMVVYKRLDGRDLRQLCAEGHTDCLTGLAEFLAHLHESGVFFRAIHLGNLLVQPDGTFALLDIADLNTRRRPLGAFRRARNLAHLLNTHEDKAWFVSLGVDAFFDEYLSHTRTSSLQRWLFGKRFRAALDDDVRTALDSRG